MVEPPLDPPLLRTATTPGRPGPVGSAGPELTTVCLVRHGETDWNSLGRLQGREDVPLNARGREQARRAADALRRGSWDLVLASPLRRAWQTAAIVAGGLELPPILAVPELVERDYGAASGLTRAEAARRFPDGVVPGEEPPAAVRERCLRALSYWVERRRGARMLVVTHGGAISALLTAVSDGAVSPAPGALANACLNVVHHDGDRWTVEAHNVVDHLGEDQPVTLSAASVAASIAPPAVTPPADTPGSGIG